MKVFKFGGTSVGLPERMKRVAELVTDDDEIKIVVLSALSGTTNALVEIGDLLLLQKGDVAKHLVNELKDHYSKFIDELYSNPNVKYDAQNGIDGFFDEIRSLTAIRDFNDGNNKTLVAYGEMMSTFLFHHYLNEQNINNKLVSALDFMRIDENGEPHMAEIENLISGQLDNEYRLFITQGFICRNKEGHIDNLKRGGSDYTASLIGAAAKADEIQIWTDIDGVHNNDPRVVSNTHPISQLSFDEASELAYFGAKVLHPSTIVPAQMAGIPVILKSTLNPEAPGTTISNKKSAGQIKAIAAKDNITAIKIKSTRMLLAYGFLRKVFSVFEEYKTPIDMITTSEVAVSVTIDNPTHLKSIVKALEIFGHVEVDQNQTIVCIVGDMVSESKGVIARIFDAIPDIPVRMVSYGGSRNNISILIDSQYKKQALTQLNDHVQ